MAISQKERERNARRIRMSVGGVKYFLGRAPTLEAAAQIRQTIKEAPRGVHP